MAAALGSSSPDSGGWPQQRKYYGGPQTVRPHAVDINSGVEISPGEKDSGKVKEIIEMIRRRITGIPCSNLCVTPSVKNTPNRYEEITGKG